MIPGGALHSLGQAVDYKGEHFTPVLKQPVISYSLDHFVDQMLISVPNHIKIDVDGIEFLILKGASNVLKKESLKTLMIEVDENDKKLDAMMKYLLDRDLEFIDKYRYVEGGET